MKFLKKTQTKYRITAGGETKISLNYPLSKLLRSMNLGKIKEGLCGQDFDLDSFIALEPQHSGMPHKVNLLETGCEFHDAEGFLASGKDVGKLVTYLKANLSKARHAKMWVNEKVVLDNFEKEAMDLD